MPDDQLNPEPSRARSRMVVMLLVCVLMAVLAYLLHGMPGMDHGGRGADIQMVRS